MSRQSDNVKSWRQRFKARIRQALGGKCCSCGYEKYEGALEIHHLDMADKEISFGAVLANPRAAASLIDELKKCVLVCKNCHVEIHFGSTPNPSASTFNETLYLDLIK